jgi:hypothetical protein
MQQKVLTSDNFHNLLIEECFSTDISDEEAFLLFVVLHLYAIRIPEGLLSDRPESTKWHGLTQRGASASLAYLWRNTNDERREDMYWYWRWNKEWNEYAHAENLSQAEQEALSKIISKLCEHPWVVNIFEDD